MKRNNKWQTALLWLVMCLPLSACALSGVRSGHAIEGRVLEAGTNKPIPDAIVVARWIGHLAGYADGKTVCYQVMSATTDVNGKYSMPAWRKEITEEWQKNVSPEEVKVDAYKAGYKWVSGFPKDKYVEYLQLDTGSIQERLDYLISSSVSCSSDEDKKLLPLYQSLYREADHIASTKEQKLKALILLIEVEKQEIGSTAAWRRFEQKKRELR